MSVISYQQFKDKILNMKLIRDTHMDLEKIKQEDLYSAYLYSINTFGNKLDLCFMTFIRDLYVSGLSHWKERIDYWSRHKKKITWGNFINRYGCIAGSQKYKRYTDKQKYNSSIERYIEKYGREEGTVLYNKMVESKSMSLNGFIKRYGEELGRQKYQQFCDRNKGNFSLDRKIEIYGEKIASAKYEMQKDKLKYIKTREYYLNKYGNDSLFWKRIKAMNRTQTKEAYIKKYGSDASKMKDHTSLESFIRTYGEETGKIKYQDYIDKMRYKNSYQCLLDNYDEKTAEELWKKRFSNFTHCSNLSTSCFDEIMSCFENFEYSVHYGYGNEFGKYDKVNKRYYFYDFVIPAFKYCIEFNGDLYHANPQMFVSEDVPDFPQNNKTAQMIWDFDKDKINLLESLGFTVDIIWENDYMKNKNKIILLYQQKIKNFISKEKNNA